MALYRSVYYYYLNGQLGDNVIAITPFEFRNDFDVVGLRKFCSCYRVFNVVFASLDGAIREC